MEGKGISRITLRSSFKYLSGKKFWILDLSLPQDRIYLSANDTWDLLGYSWLWGGCDVHWRMFSRISGLYPETDQLINTNYPPTSPERKTKTISRYCHISDQWDVNQARAWATKYSQYCLSHSLTHSRHSTGVQIWLLLLQSCVSLD